ncbi:Ig-like domain-containing protein [Pontibacillus sp. ALD_SL1]|uniref:Ig-like domain-containing protein n=1 Tax=Pontibacillus sp. ALD_SL1 TaxID=2777185 RepID=UPI001A96AC24|nr:Ig-like domain-containing protein [Pontibacillus sp. ALD_SL1]QSS99701.1 Ig-like domain-containing protein [Pontibacillus sp. ALD_SL1]
MNIPKMVRTLALLLMLSFVANPLHTHAKEMDSKEVQPNKEWRIDFNIAVDSSKLSDEQIYVTHPSGTKVSTTLSAESPKTILIQSKKGYKTGESYTLHITPKVVFENGGKLKEEVTQPFTISGDSEPTPVNSPLIYTDGNSIFYSAEYNQNGNIKYHKPIHTVRNAEEGLASFEDMGSYLLLDEEANRNEIDGIPSYFEYQERMIGKVQAHETEAYYTEYQYEGFATGGSCGGGGAEFYQLFKLDGDNGSTKVSEDYISSIVEEPFTIINNSVYYARVNDKGMSNYELVKTDLDGENAVTLLEEIDNFWIQGDKVYYTNEQTLHAMDLDGSNQEELPTKGELYEDNACGVSNYTVGSNGITYETYTDEGSVKYYYDFETKSETLLNSIGFEKVLAVDTDNNEYIGLDYGRWDQPNNDVISIYNLSTGEKKKELITDLDYGNSQLEVFSSERRVQYIKSSKLLQISY